VASPQKEGKNVSRIKEKVSAGTDDVIGKVMPVSAAQLVSALTARRVLAYSPLLSRLRLKAISGLPVFGPALCRKTKTRF
jgi:hypothetical protein